jgi:mono/diheme cytochrome c family protein
LAHSLVVTFDTTGEALGKYVRVGNPTNGMPPSNLTDAQFSDLSAFLRATAQAQSARRPADAAAVLVGDPKAGESFFNGEGKCISCHSVTQDLKGVGAKYQPQQLQGRIVYPRGRGGYPGFGQAVTDPPYTATATLYDGRKISGAVVTLSDYLVTIRDAGGALYTVSRTASAKVEITDPLQAHVDRMKSLTDKQMHDLTAYLAGVK